MIKEGDFIFIKFVNGLYLNVIVESWSNEEAIVLYPEDKSKIILYNIKKNVLFIKILNKENIPENKEKKYSKLKEEFSNLANQTKTNTVLGSLAELKDEMNKIEREEFIRKAHSHIPSGVRNVEYGTPRVIPVARIKEHPSQETSSQDSRVNKSLQQLFKKKNR